MPREESRSRCNLEQVYFTSKTITRGFIKIKEIDFLILYLFLLFISSSLPDLYDSKPTDNFQCLRQV